MVVIFVCALSLCLVLQDCRDHVGPISHTRSLLVILSSVPDLVQGCFPAVSRLLRPKTAA